MIDVDGVPGPELLSFEGTPGAFRLVVRSMSTGSIFAQSAETYAFSSFSAVSPWAMDLDGDSDPDVMFEDDAGRRILYELSGSGLTFRWAFDPPAGPWNCWGLQFENIDADPQKELIVTEGRDLADGGSRVRFLDGYTLAEEYVFVPSPATDACPQTAIVDADNTGVPELLFVFGGDLYVLESSQNLVGVGPRGGFGPRVGLNTAAPSPASGTMRITFTVPRRQPVRLRVHDVAGREVSLLHTGLLDAGEHEVLWDGRGRDGASSLPGVYWVRLQMPDGVSVRKVIRLQ